MVDFNLQAITLILVGFIELILGAIVYFKEKKNLSNVFFSFFTFSISAWVLSRALFEITDIGIISDISAVSLYISASLIPLFFVLFTYIFPLGRNILSKRKIFFIVFIDVVVILLTLVPGFVIRDIVSGVSGSKIILFGDGYFVYGVYIVAYFLWGFINLLKKYQASSGVFKIQLIFIFTGVFISVLAGVTTNLILPFFGNFTFFWLGPILTVVMVFFVFYAILKLKLFDIKVLLAELLVLFIGTALSVKLFLIETPKELVIESVTLIFIVILGTFLIRSVRSEVKRREDTELLVEELRVVNQKLKELDEQKSDFISIASHQLRTPLTAIRGYTSMMQEGVYGRIGKKANDVVDKILHSSQRLVFIVNDLLDMSRIEQGRFKYSPECLNIVDVVGDVIEELKETAKEKGLKLVFKKNKNKLIINADRIKIRQVFANIIDNSIKYTNSGSVSVSVSKSDNKKNVIVRIQDTGMGIEENSSSKIFEKFTRAKEAIKTHTEGSGIGLFVAREIARAHKGDVWVESDGLGEGASFFVSLPLKK